MALTGDDGVELSPVGHEAADILLELVGETAKLALLLCELGEEEIAALSGRLGAFLSLVHDLPVKAHDPTDVIGKTEGQA